MRGAFRVLTFLTIANLAGTAFYLPRARAAAEELAVSRGLAVLRQLDPMLQGSDQAMSINGQRMFLASRTTPLELKAVLALFEQDCQASSGGLSEQLGKLPTQFQGSAIPEQLRDPSRWFTVRQEDGAAGQVTCFARSDSPGGLKGLISRLSAFAETGELSELGDARYIVARRDESTQLTHVLAMWTEGSFNVLRMFPKSGDAPGRDSSVVPRPPNSVRVLSAEPPDKPYALRMYDSEQAPAEILSGYTKVMEARGWSSITAPQSSEVDLNESSRTFTKDGRAVIVVVNTTPEQKSGVNLIEMGNQGFATVATRQAP
jgi:hypothetical protein